MSARIDTLARPRVVTKKYNRKEAEKRTFVVPDALTYVASPRVVEISQPRNVVGKYEPPKGYQSVVAPEALTYEASTRIAEISVPRVKTRKFRRRRGFVSLVKPKALTAKCSERVDHLSRSFVPYIKSALEEYKHIDPKLAEKMQKNVARSENAMYKAHECPPPPPQKFLVRSYMYKKLAKGPKPRTKEQELARLQKWVEKNALPRKEHLPPELPPSASMPLKKMMPKILTLSTPKKRLQVKKFIEQEVEDTSIKHSVLTYKATDKIKYLAIAKVAPIVEEIPVPRPIPPEVLRYHATKRIQQMSEPKVRDESHLEEPPFPRPIPSRALKYRASKRTKAMSQPKPIMFEPDPCCKEHPYDVAPAALNANASARTKKLAEPRPDYSTMPPPEEKSDKKKKKKKPK